MQRCGFVLIVAAVILASRPAAAGVYQDIFQGLQWAATPSGFPLQETGDGTRVNGSRSGRLRIVPTGFGPGYQLEFDRTFGADSRGRPETYYFGGLGQMTLTGTTQATLNYTGEKFRTIRGQFAANNLAYDIRTNDGVQDVEYAGTFNFQGNLEVNPLGFYSVQFAASNSNATVTVDGVVVRNEDSTNFSLGPVTLSGNVYVDGLAAVLSGLGVDTTGLEQLFPESPIALIDEEIQAQLQSLNAVAGETMSADVSKLVLDTVLQQSIGAALGSALDGRTPLEAPEPGTMLLMAGGVAALVRPRRR